MARILLLHGPNLNALGYRNKEIYGDLRLNQVDARLTQEAERHGHILEAKQSNHEGQLIDWIQETYLNPLSNWKGIILNPGGLAHTSVCLRDAVDDARHNGVPTIEVHLSNITEREFFRQSSHLRGVCLEYFGGRGLESYIEALSFLSRHLKKTERIE